MITEPDHQKKIEQIARICYKSEDKICEGSDVKMIRSLCERKHFAMLEHASICVRVPAKLYEVIEQVKVWSESAIMPFINESERSARTPQVSYIHMTRNDSEPTGLVSGNMRAWLGLIATWFVYNKAFSSNVNKELFELLMNEAPAVFTNGFRFPISSDTMSTDITGCKVIKDFNELSDSERLVHEYMSVLFTTDRGVTHELVRHRPCSFAQESTRYCNYSKDKHDNQVTFIEPLFYGDGREDEYNAWRSAMEDAECYYLGLIERGSKPQEARSVLPHSTKVDIVMTANLMEWNHIFSLRACNSTGPAHPQMREIMCPCLRDAREMYPFAFGDLVMPEEIVNR